MTGFFELKPPGNGIGSGPTWTEQYLRGLAGEFDPLHRQAMAPASTEELQQSSKRIASRVPPLADEAAWRARGNVVRGAVVGAIQSGKTASMIGVAAEALDAGFRLVVVLAGLKDDLRLQTARRFITDLLQRGDELPLVRGQYTHPAGFGEHGLLKSDRCWSPGYQYDAKDWGPLVPELRIRLKQGGSALLVVKKNRMMLTRLGHILSGLATVLPGPLPMIVLDDECDEASVGKNPGAPTPREIASLWTVATRGAWPTAYVGYTATPHSNILQDDRGDLYPADFIEPLRVASREESRLTFAAPHLKDWYTGGEAFYCFLRQSGRLNWMVQPTIGPAEEAGAATDWNSSVLANALVDYFVSGAVRLLEQENASFEDPHRVPAAHSMLVHTDAEQAAHEEYAERIRSICNRFGGADGRPIWRVPCHERLLPSSLATWLSSRPEDFKEAYERAVTARRDLVELVPGCRPPTLPTYSDVEIALRKVFANVKLKIVNASANNEDRPLDFERPVTADGRPGIPEDIYTIAVGGNVLGRGLTLKGLCTTYYTRSAGFKVDDTTLQRQRWFGYRGSHLEFCRIFTTRAISQELRQFHANDEYLREQIADCAAEGLAPSSAGYAFLRMAGGAPSNKLGTGVRVKLSFSGTKPFVRKLQTGGNDARNRLGLENLRATNDLLRWLRLEGMERRHEAYNEPIGLISSSPVDALTAAAWLCRLAYSDHNPSGASGAYAVLAKLEETWGLSAGDVVRRQADGREVIETIEAASDPYLIASYLRMWHYAAARHAQGCEVSFQAADGSPWMPRVPPKFNVGVRYGSRACEQLDGHLCMARDVTAAGQLTGAWGSRNFPKGYYGDDWFDIDPEVVPGSPLRAYSRARRIEDPGLLLLHIVSEDAGECSADEWPRPTFGVVVPSGGPALFGAIP